MSNPHKAAHLIQVDPIAYGFPAPDGSFAYSFLTNALYVKVGGGLRDWLVVGTGGLSSQIFISTDEINMLQASSDNLFTPLPEGYLFATTTWRWLITEVNGTIGTGATCNAGNNAAKTNVLGSAVQLTTAVVATANTNGAPVFVAGGNTTNLTGQKSFDTRNRFKLDVTSPASGGTATILKARGQIFGTLVPIT